MKNLIKLVLLACFYFSCAQVLTDDVKYSANFYGSSDPMEKIDHRSNIDKFFDQSREFVFASFSAGGWLLKETIKTIPNAAWFGAGSVGGVWLLYRLFFKRRLATHNDVKRVEVNVSALRKLVELNHAAAKGWFEDLERKVDSKFERVYTRFDSVDDRLNNLLSGQEKHKSLLGSLDSQVKDVAIKQENLQSSLDASNAKQSSEHVEIRNAIDSLSKVVVNGFSGLNSRMDQFGGRIDNAAERLSRLEELMTSSNGAAYIVLRRPRLLGASS